MVLKVLAISELFCAQNVSGLQCSHLAKQMGLAATPPPPRPPVDSILKLMTVWKKTGKIIRTAIIVNYICTCIVYSKVLTIPGLAHFCVSVKVKLTVPLLHV